MSDELQPLAVQEQQGGLPEAKKVLRRTIDALTDRQKTALKLIGEGRSIQKVGEAIAVDPGTVYRWIRTDAHFRAAYNAWQLEQRESCRTALLKCAGNAVVRITRSVELDPDLAYKLVKDMGLLRGGRQLQTDPKHIERQLEIEELEAEERLEARHDDVLDDDRDSPLMMLAGRALAQGLPKSNPLPSKTSTGTNDE